jgi:hypothetical protein
MCALDADRLSYIVSSPTANYERGVCVCATAIILGVLCDKYLKVQFQIIRDRA